MKLFVAAVVLCCASGPAIAGAQAVEPSTRAEALAQARAQREQHLEPPSRPAIERAMIFVEEHRIIERLNPPEGLYPALGGVTLGSSWGIGAGYRRRPARGRVVLDTGLTYTLRAYKLARASVTLPRAMGSPLDLRAGVRWYDYTQEDFFGIGPASLAEDRISFGLRGVDVSFGAEGRPLPWLVVGGSAGLQTFDVRGGTDPRFPSIEERFDDTTAPGLDRTPDLRFAQAVAGVDTRDQRGNPRGGGLYRAAFGLYRGTQSSDFDFNRIDLNAMQVFPIFDKKRTFAVNVVASKVDPIGEARVPFFLMPTVGGQRSVRGQRDFRFRDAAIVSASAEYRWEAFSGLDLALFADAGQAAPSWTAVTPRAFSTAWGLGFRFNTNRRVFLRIDTALGGNGGRRVWIRMGPVY
ncbi:MAG: BamA/TamA family outer membrane protein [Vicinamibacterales bacterium]